MIITNNNFLPELFMEALLNCENRARYDNGTAICSVTELLKPVQMFFLEKTQPNKVQTDAADMINLMIGTAIHAYFEEWLNEEETLKEHKISANFDYKKINGTVDLYRKGILYDFKTTSASSWTYGVKDEWKWQINIYKHMLINNNKPVSNMRLIVIFKDWNKKMVGTKGYPEKPVLEIEIDHIPEWELTAFISEKLNAIDEAMITLIPRECSLEEKWQSPKQFAVMQKGKARALRLLPTLEEAEYYKANAGDNCYIEIRESLPKRCVDYCNVSHICQQRQKELSSISNTENELEF